MKRTRHVWCWLFMLAGPMGFLCATQAQANQQTAVSQASPAALHQMPVMDGSAGPCSLELTATTPDGKPVYDATIKVHIAYGFGGFRRLDLQAGTNVDGKVKFMGLPSRVRRPPLEFLASKDQWAGTVTYDPNEELSRAGGPPLRSAWFARITQPGVPHACAFCAQGGDSTTVYFDRPDAPRKSQRLTAVGSHPFDSAEGRP